MHAVLWAALFLQAEDLDSLARRYAVTWTSDAATGREILRSGEWTLVLAPGLDVALVNGTAHKLARPVQVVGGRVQVPEELAKLLDGSVAARKEPAKKVDPVPAKPKKWFTVALDPGHGGMHTGCKGKSGVLEKELTLDLALRLRAILEEAGGTVTLTRSDDRHFDEDVHRDLQHRCDQVNRAKPDLFLSIHVNYVARTEPRGFEMWIRKNDRISRDLASFLRAEFVRALDTDDRGIKDDKSLYVLRNTTCPAVLVECGFISNPSEERDLCDPEHRQKLALAMAEAVKRYLASRK